MRNGRRGENFRPVENENSSRHSGGKQVNSPAINDKGWRTPVMATQTQWHACWTSAAMRSGPGSAANSANRGWSTGTAAPGGEKASSRGQGVSGLPQPVVRHRPNHA